MSNPNRRPILAGNWKMHLTLAEGLALATEIRNRCGRFRQADVVLAPVSLALLSIVERLADSNVAVAAQNCHAAAKGAFTGEVSPVQLRDLGVRYVILGHSERRQFFGENDEGVGKKGRSTVDAGLIPILCVGESLAEREAGRTLEVVTRQLDGALALLLPEEVGGVVLAYEPVWAIGTGRTATPAQAQETHAAIRRRVASTHGEDAAKNVRIQYGGSVKPDNIAELMAEADIDGALVGGASLDADSFVNIVTRAVHASGLE
ncbi:MAG: triose-phosphate isomerase [Myxococcales bacterium]|nr:triose-phosphate isomerase [Myxococcales bacterium]